MTIANHILIGAGLAIAIKNPAVVLPLAFASHFVLDALPHFGYNREGVGASLNHYSTYIVQLLGALGLGVLFVTVNVYSWLVITAMLLAAAPDFEWLYLYVYYHAKGGLPHANRFTRFHRRIQWGERPWGILIEVPFFVVVLIAIQHIAVR